MHFDGAQVSIYFATFPADYLRIIRNEGLDCLSDRADKIALNHTRLYNLFSTVDRTEFIKEFVAWNDCTFQNGTGRENGSVGPKIAIAILLTTDEEKKWKILPGPNYNESRPVRVEPLHPSLF